MNVINLLSTIQSEKYMMKLDETHDKMITLFYSYFVFVVEDNVRRNAFRHILKA